MSLSKPTLAEKTKQFNINVRRSRKSESEFYEPERREAEENAQIQEFINEM